MALSFGFLLVLASLSTISLSEDGVETVSSLYQNQTTALQFYRILSINTSYKQLASHFSEAPLNSSPLKCV